MNWRVVEVWECALKGRLRLETNKVAELLSVAIRSTETDFVTIHGLAVEA